MTPFDSPLGKGWAEAGPGFVHEQVELQRQGRPVTPKSGL